MRLTKEDFPIDLQCQSLEIPNSGGIRQSTLAPLGVTLEYKYEDTKTLVDVMQRGYKASNNGPCLGWRDSDPNYKWLSYAEVIERSKNISCGLVHAGMKKGQESCIGIYSQNCVEWILIEQACYYQSSVLVPLYDTLGPTACSYILNHVEAEFLVCDTVQKVKTILNSEEEIPKLCHIVVIEELDEQLKALAVKKGITLHQLSTIEESGKRKPEPVLLPRPSDLATICFTSGTTGNPKGVMLTHGNLVIAASAFERNLGTNCLTSGDIYLSYLPLAHVLDRMSQILIYNNGGSVGFFRGDIKLLFGDIAALKPTFFPTVPRVLNRIFEKVQNEVSSSKLKKMLLGIALKAKEAELNKGVIRNNSFWDNIVFKNIRNIFGGRVKLLVSAGAPIREEVLLFFKCSLGCPVVEAYGQTEAAGATNCTVVGDFKGGVVGPPVSCVFMKLLDVPDMGYYSKNNEGEVLAKGPTIMEGYFKDPARTAEVLDEDGWLHTGDIGRWAENGALTIIDRKKHLLKLSQGEYISPVKIEDVYLVCPLVEQIFVDGDALENFLVAVVAPDKEYLMSWCSQRGIGGSWEEVCENQVVKTHILKEMCQLGKIAGLKGFEQVKAIYLYPDGFSFQNGILTATMKVKREECHRRFKHEIKKMYESKREKL